MPVRERNFELLVILLYQVQCFMCSRFAPYFESKRIVLTTEISSRMRPYISKNNIKENDFYCKCVYFYTKLHVSLLFTLLISWTINQTEKNVALRSFLCPGRIKKDTWSKNNKIMIVWWLSWWLHLQFFLFQTWN